METTTNRIGKIRKSSKKIIDSMSTTIALDLLSTCSNRCSSFSFRIPFVDSWLGKVARWDEVTYAEFTALHKIGLAEQIRVYTDMETGEVSLGLVPLRKTKRIPYMTTDDDGNAIVKQAHL